MNKLTRETWNVIQLGIGMCLVFFAFTAQGFIIETVLSDRHDEDPKISDNAGYYSQTIIYGCFIFSNIIAPPIIKLLTPKWSLVFGSSAYTVYMLGFQFLNPYYLYASAAYEGLCAGALWTAMGEYLALNSTEKTIGRNSGLVWIIYTSSFIFGGIFMLLMFGSSADEYISKGQMRALFGCFCLVCFLGNCVFALLEPRNGYKKEDRFRIKDYVMELKKSWDLLWTIDMLLLLPLFGFSGMELSFYSSVYSTALSFTKQFSINTNKLMAYNSIAVGVGELAGGIPFLLLGKRLTLRKYGNTMIVILGVIVATAAYTITDINLPGKASYEKTYDTSLISNPSVALALVGGALLGFTDACINTAIYSFVTIRYEGETVQAFALHKLVHAALSTVCMFYGSVLELQWQILILLIGAGISTVTFAMVEMRWNFKSQEINIHF